jgi:hypothetical protein
MSVGFDGKIRDGLLNPERFDTLLEAECIDECPDRGV